MKSQDELPLDRRIRTPELRRTLIWFCSAIFISIILLIAFFDFNWLKPPIERLLSRELGRTVRISGNIAAHLLTWYPSATVDGLSVGNPSWAPKGTTVDVRRLSVQVTLRSLLVGQLDLLRVDLDSPHFDLLRDEQGRATWEFGKTAAANAEPPDLPPIRQFTIHNGMVRVTDVQRKLALTGRISSREYATGGQSAFQLEGHGTMNGKPFLMHVIGGPLINIDRSRPYKFDAQMATGATHVTAKGSVTHPFDLRRITGDVVIAGPDLADLYYITGLALPGTPPYRLTAHVTRAGTFTSMTGMSGTVGQSDLQGSASIDRSTGRPFVTANVKSHALHFTDLGPLVGSRAPAAVIAVAAIKSRVSPAASAAEAKEKMDGARLLPDTRMPVERIRQMDADVVFHADQVVSADFPLRQLDLRLKINHGILVANPVSMALAVGKLRSTVRIDARSSSPQINVDARLQDVNLQQFTSGKDLSLQGMMEARVEIQGRGDSVHQVAMNADGSLTAIVPHGVVGKRFADLLGIDIDRAFLFDANDKTTMRCAVADFQTHNGMLTARNVLFDSDVARADITGTINVRNETLNLEISGAPKKLTLFRLRSPIEITGPIQHPKVGLKSGAVATQVGTSIALGIFATPFAALLPFVDPGLATNADCKAVIADTHRNEPPNTTKK